MSGKTKLPDRKGNHLQELRTTCAAYDRWHVTPIVFKNFSVEPLMRVRYEASWGEWGRDAPEYVAPFGVMWCSLVGGKWSPAGVAGHAVYDIGDTNMELLIGVSSSPLGTVSTTIEVGEKGTDWGKTWQQNLVTGNKPPKKAENTVYVTSYTSKTGGEACFTVEDRGEDLPEDGDEDESGGGCEDVKVADDEYYKILGVGPGVSMGEIKKQYRKMALKFHPDKNPNNPIAEQKFKNLAAAYEVIGDEESRRKYDLNGKTDNNSEAEIMKTSLNRLFGNGILKEEIGNLEVLQQLDPTAMRAKMSLSPEQADTQRSETDKHRAHSLAYTLLEKLESYVDNETRWRITLERDLFKKVKQSPGIGEVLRTIGQGYQQQARQFMHRYCGLQAVWEGQRESSDACSRTCARLGRVVNITWVQAWAEKWQERLNLLGVIGTRVRSKAFPGVTEAELKQVLVDFGQHGEATDEFKDLLGEAVEKLKAGDNIAAADLIDKAVTTQRDAIQLQYKKKIEVQGLTYLFEEGCNEADYFSRHAARVLIHNLLQVDLDDAIRLPTDISKTQPQVEKMLFALEYMGSRYIYWGHKEQTTVDFEKMQSEMHH